MITETGKRPETPRSILRKAFLGLLTIAGIVATAAAYEGYTYMRTTRFDRMAPTSLGELPSLSFLETRVNQDGRICTMYTNAAPLDYRDYLLPDPNMMTIACSENGVNFVVVKTFEGQGPENNKEIFENIASLLTPAPAKR